MSPVVGIKPMSRVTKPPYIRLRHFNRVKAVWTLGCIRESFGLRVQNTVRLRAGDKTRWPIPRFARFPSLATSRLPTIVRNCFETKLRKM